MNTIFLKSLFALLASLLLFTLMPGQAAAAQCGGLNQKSCWNIDPKKWCDPGLKYVGNGKIGGGRCVRPESAPKPEPKPACGGLNQSSCWNVNPKMWCDPGLEYVGNGKIGGGRCVTPRAKPKPACGGLNQSSCWNVNPKMWCDPGLEYVGNGTIGGGRCVKPGTDVTPNCGGLGQKSCWNINPAKWCDPGLEYYGTGKPGEGRCIAPGSDPTPDCGGLNQKSCWNPNPKFWCDDGMTYSPGVIPGEGTCYRKISNEEYKTAAEKMYETFKMVGPDNPLLRLRTCLLRPENLEKLKQAMNARSKNAVNTVLAICRISLDDFKTYGSAVLGLAPKTLHISLSGGAVAGVGIEGAISYAIPLHPRPDGRFFLTNAVGGGAGFAGGVDVAVGLTSEEMPTEHWAVDKGRAVNFSGKLIGGASVSIDFPERDITPNGFTVGGGLGAGAEIGTVNFTRDQYLYNF